MKSATLQRAGSRQRRPQYFFSRGCGCRSRVVKVPPRGWKLQISGISADFLAPAIPYRPTDFHGHQKCGKHSTDRRRIDMNKPLLKHYGTIFSDSIIFYLPQQHCPHQVRFMRSTQAGLPQAAPDLRERRQVRAPGPSSQRACGCARRVVLILPRRW